MWVIEDLFFIAGPNVCVENENCIVNFGNVECGKSSVGVIHLKNKSNVSTLYQVLSLVHIPFSRAA